MASSQVIRTAITPDEWDALRKIAIDRKTSVAKLVAETLRDALLKGVKP